MRFVTFNTNAWWNSMAAFSKTLTRTPVTKTLNNTTGDETLTEGTDVEIEGVFFKRGQMRNLEKFGQIIGNADAMLLLLPSVTLNVDDVVTYNSEEFRVDTIIRRDIGEVHFYNAYQLFRVQ